ncbi:MAG TPA: hypothetical protein DCW98_02965, partial [Bacteroidales bacterium]|nr:hypothetical protein [Bacteroidales bacterium]
HIQAVEDAILYTYKIKDDDTRLRADASRFEKQRATYPIRREFSAFTVTLKNDIGEQAAIILRQMGFNVNN